MVINPFMFSRNRATAVAASRSLLADELSPILLSDNCERMLTTTRLGYALRSFLAK